MISQKTILEVKVAGRVFELSCDPAATLPEVAQALNGMQQYVASKLEEHMKKDEPPKEAS